MLCIISSYIIPYLNELLVLTLVLHLAKCHAVLVLA